MTLRSSAGGPVDGALVRFANGVRGRQPSAVDAVAVALKAEIQVQLSKPGMGRYYAKVRQNRDAFTPALPSSPTGRLKKTLERNRRLNAIRTSTARNLNRGSIKFGDITRRDVLTGLHRASKPGDPPAPDTGALKRSAFVERVGAGARVGVAMAYGPALELGTTRAGRSRRTVILPRPFMRPALAMIRARLGEVLVGPLRTAAR
jgi:hypothetical protein